MSFYIVDSVIHVLGQLPQYLLQYYPLPEPRRLSPYTPHLNPEHISTAADTLNTLLACFASINTLALYSLMRFRPVATQVGGPYYPW